MGLDQLVHHSLCDVSRWLPPVHGRFPHALPAQALEHSAAQSIEGRFGNRCASPCAPRGCDATLLVVCEAQKKKAMTSSGQVVPETMRASVLRMGRVSSWLNARRPCSVRMKFLFV